MPSLLPGRGIPWRARLLSLAAAALVSAAQPSPAAAQPGADRQAITELVELNKHLAALEESGNTTEARANADRQLALLRDLPDIMRPGYGLLQKDLARFYLGHGDHARAEALLLRVLAVGEFDDDYENGDLQILLGEVYLAFGDLQRARELLERAEPLVQGWRTFGAIDALARLHLEQGTVSAFEDVLARMRAFLRDNSDGWRLAYLMPDLRAAQLRLRRGDVQEAERRLLELRPQIELDLGALHPLRAELLQDLGVLLSRKGDPAAESLLLRALVIRERIFAPGHPAILRTLGHLANLYVAQGRLSDAVRTRERAAALQDQAAQVDLARGSERQKRLYMGIVQRDTDAAVSLHLRSAPRDQAAARLALRTILRRKGLVLDAIAESYVAVRRSLDAEGQALFDALARLGARISTAIYRGPIDMPAEEHRREVQALEAERQKLEVELAVRAQAARPEGAPAPQVTLERVQAALPEGAMLVELVQYRPHAPFGPPVEPTWGKPRYAAYVVGRRGDVTGLDLGDAAAIDAVAERLSQDLADPGRDPRMNARHLDALVMQPIRAALGAARWLLLSPDGALNLVPFAALVDEEGRDLIERASFTYLTSGRDLLRPRGAAGAPRGEEVVVFANPAFGALGSAAPDEGYTRGVRSAGMAEVRFSPLPGTEREAEAVRRALSGARVLTAAGATEEALKEMHRPRVLHIATHGFFLPDQAASDGAAAAGSADLEALHGGENPLLRSGLALAGANARRSLSDRDDGILTALELSELDLHGTQLVVLSACETGLGRVARGEGVYGLRRALLLAGAETQVMSLWKVGDAATRELMTSYYAALARGGGRGEALRSAQLEIRRERPHPHAWAGFIPSGEGAALDGRQVAPSFPRAAKGPRGCTCAAGEDGGAGTPALAALAAGLLLARGRRGVLRRRG